MKRLSTNRGQTTMAFVLVTVALFLYGYSIQRAGQQISDMGPSVRFSDDTPLGGKGLRLLMEKLGYTVKRTDVRLQSIPGDARVWLILNGQTHFSRAESADLMQWVRKGGTLVFAVPPSNISLNLSAFGEATDDGNGIDVLCAQLGVKRTYFGPLPNDPDTGFPQLTTLPPSAASQYWSGVNRATASRNQLNLAEPSPANTIPSTKPAATPTPGVVPSPTKAPSSPFLGLSRRYQEGDEAASVETLEIAGTPAGPILVQRRFGQGRVILMPDPLMLSNYGLVHDDNAVLTSNLLRYGTATGSTIYFDERDHGEPDSNATTAPPDSFLRYLRVPAVRAVLLQLLGAILLVWMLFGTRLGAAVAIPENDPVTRASNFARAMGALFYKAGRSGAASAILASEFRRLVARRVGLTTGDAPDLIASRVAQAADVPQPLVARLLAKAKFAPQEQPISLLEHAPRFIERMTTGDPEVDNEESLVRDAQEMEDILRRLGIRR